MESDDYEDAIRKSVSLGGDSDTQACITGGIAQAHYKSIPKKIVERVNQVLPKEFRNIIGESTPDSKFTSRCHNSHPSDAGNKIDKHSYTETC